MTARNTDSTRGTQTAPVTGRTIPASAFVMNVVVRVAGIVPVRLDLSHAGTAEQQLGMSLGTVLVYLRSAQTARAVAEGWGRAVVHARALSAAVVGRRPAPVGPSTIAAMVRMAGLPHVTAALEPARPSKGTPAMVRVQVGPVTWEVCDATAYASLLRAWRQAARLLDQNPTEDEC